MSDLVSAWNERDRLGSNPSPPELRTSTQAELRGKICRSRVLVWAMPAVTERAEARLGKRLCNTQPGASEPACCRHAAGCG